MNPIQFTTIEEAQEMQSFYGYIGGGAKIEIPEMAYGQAAPQFDSTHLFYFLRFANSFVSNCGLLLNTIEQRGSAGSKEALKAEMKDRGLMLPWWI